MKNLVVLTGAGMSAESGISTFRDAGGLWDQYPVEQVATPEGYAANPKLVIDFYNERRKQLLAVKPNRGHKLVSEMEKFFNVTVITQNIDNLHERAGSSHIIHLHGELTKVTSSWQPNNPAYIKELKPEEYEIHLGDLAGDGSQFRPFIVWFGESVPMIETAIEYAETADIFLIIGTSLNVYPAAQFESLTYPFIIMFSIPFAFSGVLMALYGTGTTLNVMSLLGGIMLIGIVVKNGIVLIDYITLCRERGMSVIHSVVVSGRSRLRPVLMTTLTTILGMVPMAIGGGEGSEMWQPLGVSVIGGLTVSTVLTLILVPVLYCSFAGTGIKRNRKKMKASRELNDYYQAHKTEMTKGKKE